ncbi:MAG: RelA/SpoT family protein [Burkholderiales bacterium]|jgi:guanosine-3',5'-bis(diphosphate) 3'-pyrophosphohydrolase
MSEPLYQTNPHYPPVPASTPSSETLERPFGASQRAGSMVARSSQFRLSEEGFFIAPDHKSIASIGSLTAKLEAYLSRADIKRVRAAYRLADEAHLGQFRQSGEPYVSHPIAVAEICAAWKLDVDSLMAALLHDTIEDSGISKEELSVQFGVSVAELVDGLSKLDKMEFQTRAHAQAESFRKMLLAMANDVRVILIKLADRLHNMRTLTAVSPQKARRIADETIEIYAPIANRLGLHSIFLELLDLSFRHSHPNRYKILRKAVLSARGNRREVLSRIVDATQRVLPQWGVDAEVTGREKSLYGIYRKMREKRLSFSQVLDVYGFRIIVPTIADCYKSLGALHATFKPILGRFKDYIAIPKVNGYQSLHTTLIGPFGTPVEFQIRTQEMQRIAESGVASHWLYKAKDESFSDLQRETHQWLKSLLDIQSNTGDSLEFIEHVKVDLFPDAVYIFTPKGDIRALPKGSTVIDFAYSVHTDIGNHAVGATINGEISPLSTVLRSGDRIIVNIDPISKPDPVWLSFVRTGKARAEIRHYLRTMNHRESIELGKRLLEHSMQAMHLRLDEISTQAIERGARDIGAHSVDDLFAKVGLGIQLAPAVARTIALMAGHRGATSAFLAAVHAAPIQVHGTEGSAVTFSPCCHPIPGDSIFGHLRGGHGLVIHRTDCGVAIRSRVKDSERWVEAEWSEPINGLFRTDIKVTVHDGQGVLGKIAAEIAAEGINISQVHTESTSDSMATMLFALSVRHRTHLASLMRRLRKMAEVAKLVRV